MIDYRFAEQSDLLQVAKIHKEQFKTHYLGQFSISLLIDFYKNLLDAGYVFIVAVEDGVVRGFVLGGEWKKISESLNRFMKHNLIRSFFESAIRPQTWKKSIIKLYSIFHKNERDPNNLDNIENYTLLSIATAKSSQGKGIGSGLIGAFDRAMKKETERYYLSVQDTNERAISFYIRMGFSEAYRCEGEIQMIKKI